MKAKFYLDLAIECGLIKEFTWEYGDTIQILIPFKDDRNLSIVRSTEKKKEEMRKLIGKEYTGMYETLGYEVWDYDEGIIPQGGPVSMSEDMINDLVNTHLKKMGKDISFIVPGTEVIIED